MKTSSKNKFVSLHVDILAGHSSIPVDIYIKLSDSRYVKVANANEAFHLDILDHYRKKGIHYFCVDAEEYHRFNDVFSPHIHKELEQNEGKTFCSKSSIQQTAVQLILGELFANNYLRPTTAQLLYSTLSQVIVEVKKYPKLGEVLKCFMRRKDFLSGHSLQLAYVANLVLMKLSWSSPEIMRKLSLAALLHDISLFDNQLATISCYEEMQHLSPEEQARLMEHPLQSSLYLADVDLGFPDLDQIILSHHEVPGEGFPGRVTEASISKVAALFIMCEEFITRIHGHESDVPYLHKLKQEFSEKYNQGKFSEPLQGLLGIFDDMYYYSSVNCAG